MYRTALIVAGGKGLRMGSELPKQFLPIGGKPVLMHTLEAFHRFDKRMQLILVLPREQQGFWRELCETHGFNIRHEIADYIFNHVEKAKQSEEDMWVDSYEVCTFLKISEKTLQRLRVSGTIAYSNIRGRYFYKVSEIRRMLEERLIRSNKENIDNLITNHQLYAKERGNLRKNK